MFDLVLATAAQAGLVGKGLLAALILIAVLVLRAVFIDLMSRG